MKKIISSAMAVIIALILVACTQPSQPPETQPSVNPPTATPSDKAPEATATPEPIEKIGISMPTKAMARSYNDGDAMKFYLEAADFAVDLQFANYDIATQTSQIENMIFNGCQVLVIAAIDGASLGIVMSTAEEKGVIVIAYDRLIVDTDAVDYYVTFDNYKVGTVQGEYIRDALKLDTEDGSFNIELFAGDPGDRSDSPFYHGAITVLQPYIDSGKLKVLSGQIKFEDITILGWRTETAQARMENLVKTYYSNGEKLDAVLSPNDSIALGVSNALEEASYGTEEKPYPVLTGQGCDISAVRNIIDGKQAMSVFKNTRDLVSKAVEMVTAVRNGETVPVNDTSTYDNGAKVVPAFLCAPVICTKDNFEDLLIDSGYYMWGEIIGEWSDFK